MDDNNLKCVSQWPSLMLALAMLIVFSKHSSSLTIALRYLHEILLRLEADMLLYLLMVLVNSLFEKGGHIDMGLVEISFNKDILTNWFCTELNI